ncbi:MAG TPA: hypothetical protein VMR29_08680 [Candidatus Binatia bacterium]|nr:hypothetical protein [Candidatus Binatia bacterium]
MIETIAVAIAFGTLGFTLLSLRRAHRTIASLQSDVDTVEGQNRTLQEQRDTLKSTLAETSTALESTRNSLAATEAAKQELERQHAALTESAARLEKQRAELETEVGRLRREHESLERRVVDFQGQWSHQLTTLEEEISTLIRQIGEFRKGTHLPVPRADAAAPAQAAAHPAVAASAVDPNWALSAPVGPRLAGTRPRPVNPEPLAADQAAARRI